MKIIFPMKSAFCTLVVLSVLVAMFSCQKPVSYPAAPQISLKSYEFKTAVDTTTQATGKLLNITINFTDGDGDLFNPYRDTVTLRAKVHMVFYHKVSNDFVLVPDSFWKTPYIFTLPYSSDMERNGQNKTQKGTIEFSNFFFSQPPFPFDTVMVGCTIMDMSFNTSNEVRLPKPLAFN